MKNCFITFVIPGKAAPAEFTSEPQGYEPNKFLVEWTVQSYSPVNEFLLRFRSHSDSEWREIQVKRSEKPKKDSVLLF